MSQAHSYSLQLKGQRLHSVMLSNCLHIVRNVLHCNFRYFLALGQELRYGLLVQVRVRVMVKVRVAFRFGLTVRNRLPGF